MDDSVKKLFGKFINGQCSNQEIEILMEQFGLRADELLLKQLIMAELTGEHEPAIEIPEVDKRLDAILAQVHSKVKQRSRRKAQQLAAAAVILIAATATFWMTQRNDQPAVQMDGNAQIIRPGKQSATLTLGNGQKIILGKTVNGQVVALQAGIQVIKTADGNLVYRSETNKVPADGNTNTLTTANGEQFTVTLPDGSGVTLNAASSLTYPVSFANLPKREVRLTGEAYFTVKHNSSKPFKVITRGQEVQDIGTEFNINSYNDEPAVTTTLVSGMAKVVASHGESTILLPSQQAILTGKHIKTEQVDGALFTAWRNGSFSYQNTPLETVMRQVGRWYNVEIVYQDSSLKTRKLSGSVSRYEQVAGLLKAIAYTAKVKFKVEEQLITVSAAE